MDNHEKEKWKMSENFLFPSCLTIAGSDSGGGAGIQADLRTFYAFRTYGLSAVTAVTFQNPFGVSGLHPLPPDAVRAQINAVSSEFNLRAVKTGMLFSREIMESVQTSLKEVKAPLVVDPVMIATSGSRLLKEDAVEYLKSSFLHRADWITPNIPEAAALADISISTPGDMQIAAVKISGIWNCGVVLKGGHLSSFANDVTDIVAYQGRVYLLSSPLVEDISAMLTHGTGCTFSAAFAASLARGNSWDIALREAKSFVYLSLDNSVRTGKNLRSMFPPEKILIDKTHLRCIVESV